MEPVWTVQISEVAVPFAPIWLAVSEAGLCAVEFQVSEEVFAEMLKRRGYAPAVYDRSKADGFACQLVEYLQKERSEFTFLIDWSSMRPFQREVLRRTFAVPYGKITTYAALAAEVGHPRAARAVGRAQATNPMPLVIPCHRVLGSDRKLHGYGGPGGLTMKTWLLNLEGVSYA